MGNDVKRYEGLWAPESFWYTLSFNPAQIERVCNGVGSPGTLSYHLIPNTIWGLDVTPASDIHDWMYTYPAKFPSDAEALEWKNKADRALLNNMIRLFERAEKDSWLARRLAWFRRNRAQLYFEAVQHFGGPSFWEGKNHPLEIGGQSWVLNKRETTA